MSYGGRGGDTVRQDGFFTADLRMDSKNEQAKKSCISGDKSVCSANTGTEDNVSPNTSTKSVNCQHNDQKHKCCHCLRI